MSEFRNSRIFNKLKENRFILFSFGITSLLMLFVYYCFELIPFGDVTIMRMDLYHQYGPLFAELYERIISGESLLYSWNSGMGGNFLGNLFNYLSSPLSFIILLFGHENITESIATLILLKSAFASATFCYYLKHSTGKQDYTSTAFGVLYSFCGFFIAYYWNVMWIDAMALLPLVLLGIEKIINKGSIRLYCLALAVTMISNYYMAYMICVFSVLYFLVYFVSKYELTSRLPIRNVPHYNSEEQDENDGTSSIRYSRFLNSGFRFALGSLLAAGIAAFALIPTYYALQACSATSGTFPKDYKSYFTIFDFLANHLASVDPTIRSSGEDVLPNVYCGVITILLVPLYLFTKSISKREKAANIALLGVLYCSFNINYLNYIWHGFHFPNDLPYRQSFIYSFLILVMGYKALIRIKEFTSKEILVGGIAVIGFIILVQELGSKNVEEVTVWISIIFTVLYVLVLVLMKDKRFPATAVAIFLLCCVCSEAAVANTGRYSMNQTKASYASDYKDFNVVRNQLKQRDDRFYRMELSDLRTRMDPSWYNYKGISVFSSMAYEKLSNLQQNIGMDGNYINSYTYHPQTPVYNSMVSLKYVVDNVRSAFNSQYYEETGIAQGKFTAYENKYYLPLLYCVDEAITSWDTTNDNPFEVQNNYFSLASGVNSVFEMLTPTDVYCDNLNNFMDVELETGRYSFMRSVNDVDASMTLQYTANKDQNLYVFVESKNVKEYEVNSGQFSKIIPMDNTEYVTDIGMHYAGDEISIRIPISEGNTGSVNCFVYGIEHEEFVKGYNTLSDNAINITEFKETKIIGTVTADNSCILYSSIPYDEGWKVKIDGTAVPKEKLVAIGGGLLGIMLHEGEHTVELTFIPKGLALGVSISGITILVLAFIFLFIKFKKKSDSFLPDYDAILPAQPVEEFQELEYPAHEESIEDNILDSDTDVEDDITENQEDLSEIESIPEKEEEEEASDY